MREVIEIRLTDKVLIKLHDSGHAVVHNGYLTFHLRLDKEGELEVGNAYCIRCDKVMEMSEFEDHLTGHAIEDVGF